MVHISPNCPVKTKGESGNAQSTTEQSTTSTPETISTITDQTDAVAGEHIVHICGWKLYQQENK